MKDFGKTLQIALFDGDRRPEMEEKLTSAGYRTIVLPPYEFRRPAVQPDVEAAMNVSWLIFEDAAAVEPFVSALEAAGRPAADLDEYSILGFDDCVAESMRRFSVHCDLIPQRPDCGVAAEELDAYFDPDLDRTACVVSVKGLARAFEDRLVENGFKSFRIDMVEFGFQAGTDISRPVALLAGGAFDLIWLTGAEDLAALRALCGPDEFRSVLEDVTVITEDASVRRTLASEGLRAAVPGEVLRT